MGRLIWLTAFSVFLHTAHSVKILKEPSGTNNPAFLVEAQNGAVASENVICSGFGVDAMKDGGNAVDAAIAATICSGVVNMFSSGIGGGGFMTVRVAPGEVYTIDFREIAPKHSNATMFGSDPNTSLFGGLGVGVPGELRGLEQAHQLWGKLSWKRLVSPSVKLAQGWIVGPELDRRIQSATALLLTPDFAPIFAPNGTLLKEGDRISNLNLSRTLATIAEEGPSAFYSGPIAKSIVAKVRATGGIMVEDDLATYHVNIDRSLSGTYRGRKVYTSNVPASGPVLLHMLNIMEHYHLTSQTPLNFHRMVESLKFGFAARTRIGDPAFINDTSLMDEVPTKAFGDKIFHRLTDNTTHPPEYYNPIIDEVRDHGTMHLVTVDKDRMVVSLTSTINLVFGSGVLDPNTGVILNDELDDFSRPGIPNSGGLLPSPFDYPAPRKRPTSSITPTIIENEDGSFLFATGSAGGTRIYTAVFQTILSSLDYGIGVSATIEAPRAHHVLFPNIVDLDSGFKQDLLDGLIQRGHNISVHDINNITSTIQAVKLQGNTLFAASDSRKNGIAAGY
ncbi:gamma-glutamyltranspeptidase [Mycena floridula]|nr:gamma-glutamyltranspeptidase [Mycena floridula]